MGEKLRRTGRLRADRSLLVVFLFTILIPGLLLVVFSIRALTLERRLADQQVLDRLTRAADSLARDLDAEWREWVTDLETTAASVLAGDANPSSRLQQLESTPGCGVVVFARGDAPRVWPATHVLGLGTPPATKSEGPAGMAEAERAEFVLKDDTLAFRLYAERLRIASAADRAVLLHRVARVARKLGRHEESVRALHELQTTDGAVGSLPADLVATHDIAAHWYMKNDRERLGATALEFYRGLVEGRWPLDRARYAHYASTAREWLAQSLPRTEAVTALEAVETRKLALTAAVAATLERTPPLTTDVRFYVQDDAAGHVTVWTAGVALVVSRTWLGSQISARLAEDARRDSLHLALVGPDGESVSPDALTPTLPSDVLSVISSSGDARLPWRVRVWPADMAAVSTDVARRQTAYLVTLILVMTMLAFGTYFTTRVVRREIEIARLKSDFVSTVSHEFRSPLTGIRQLGELLMRGRVANDTRRQEYYERITRESDRLSRLVENVLDFARMEDGRKEYRIESLDTSPWLREVAEAARSWHDGRMVIAADIPDDLPAIAGDRQALASAVLNLVDNAVKYSPGRQSVWLGAAPTDEGVRIRVRDEGVGIAATDRSLIFEKFRRGGGEITREVKGAGLGLSLVQHIVSAHGGRIDVDSEPGKGSTFTVTLPGSGLQAPGYSVPEPETRSQKPGA